MGFSKNVERAKERGTGLKFLRYGKNLKYESEKIYKHRTEIAKLDFNNRTVQKIGYWSPTSSKHYNYATSVLSAAYNFNEVEPAPTGGPTQ